MSLSLTTLSIGAQPDPKDRRHITVDAADLAAVEALKPRRGSTATVLDHTSGYMFTVRRAACGLGCYCALAAVNIYDARGIEGARNLSR